MSVPFPRTFPKPLPANTFALGQAAPAAANMAALGLIMAGGMAAAIIGTLFVSKVVAFVSLGIFAAAILYCAFQRPVLAVPLLFGYIAMEGMYKYLSGFSQAIYMVKPILECAFLIALLLSNRLRGVRLKQPPLAAFAALLLAWGAVEILSPTGAGLVGGFATLLVWYLAPLFLLWITYNVVSSMRQVEMICYTIVAATVVLSLFTFVQYSMGQTWTQAHLPGYEQMNQGEWSTKDATTGERIVSWRPASTASIGGGGAVWEMFGIIVGTGLLLSEKISKKAKLFLLASIGINVLGVVLSSSRLFLLTSMGMATMMFVILARTPRDLARNLAMLLVIGGIAWGGFSVAVKTSDGLITSRYSDTLANPAAKYGHDRGGVGGRAGMVMQVLTAYPFGIGYQRGTEGGNAHDRSDAGTSGVKIGRDDAFNAIAGDMGTPGLILALLILGGSMKYGWASFQAMKTQHNRALAACFIGLLGAYLVCCFGGPALTGADNLWLFLGVLFVLPAAQKNDREEAAARIEAAKSETISLAALKQVYGR